MDIRPESARGSCRGEDMRKAVKAFVLTVLMCTGFVLDTISAERGTAEEAQALVARAIEAYKADGPESFKRMTAPIPSFEIAIFMFS